MSKPALILQLQEKLKIEINLSVTADFFDFANKNTYKIDENGEIVSLNLFQNKIANIDFISDFKNLRELDLRNNPIRNFIPLQDLEYIVQLGYHNHQINSQSHIDNFIQNEIFDMSRHSSKIAAVYFHGHDYLFDNPQIINLGGRNIYKVKHYGEKSVELECIPNPSYIENFFGEDIALVSAIVGENGTGKTSLITKLFNQLIPVRIGNEKTVFFIIEQDDKVFFYSYFDLNEFRIHSEFEAEIKKFPIYGFPIYFSNYLSDSKIEKDRRNSLNLSLLNQILNSGNSEENIIANSSFSFLLFKNTQLKRWMKALSDTEVKKVLEEFSLPVFKDISVNFYGGRYEINNSVKNFRFDIADYKNRERLELETENALVVLKSIRSFLESKISLISESQPDNNQMIEFLVLKLMQFIDHLIFSPKKQNIFPKIENADNFNNLEDLKSSIEIFELLQNNFYFLDNNFRKSDKEIPFDLFFDFSKNIERIILNSEQIILDGRYQIIVDFDSAKSILDSYEQLYLKLEESFKLDNRQFIAFFPNMILSSGEEMILNLVSLLYDNKEIDTNVNLPKILFLDEADLGLHPKWKKMFINTLIKILPKIFLGMRLQVVFTTHEPLTLSDIPNNNIVYLKKQNGKTIVLDDREKPKKSFGANITDLLSDSFFVDNGLMGDFAKDKITSIINWLADENRNFQDAQYYRKIIEIIDEPLLKYKLKEMYFEKFPEDFDREREIDRLTKFADELGYKIQKK
jgi:predicted ATPase